MKKCEGGWLNKQAKELYLAVYIICSFKFHKFLGNDNNKLIATHK
jgi:hypothetical protein